MKFLLYLFRLTIIPITALIASLSSVLLIKNERLAGFVDKARLFSSGVFLAMLVFDILPDLVSDIAQAKHATDEYLIKVFLVILASYLIMLAVSKLMDQNGCPLHDKDEKHDSKNLKLFVIFMLHEFVTGVLISFSINKRSFNNMLMALMLHKIVEGLSLGIKFFTNEKNSFDNVIKLSILSGTILIGTILGNLFKEQVKYVSDLSQSVIAGSFMYIALEECMAFVKEKEEKVDKRIRNFSVFCFGAGVAMIIFNHEELLE